MKKLVVLFVMAMLASGAYAVGTGTLDQVSGWFEAGELLTVNAEVGLNSEFTEWLGTNGTDTVNNETQLVFQVQGPRAITGVFSHILWDIVAVSGANGSISDEGTNAVPQGDDKTFTFTPNQYYHVTNVIVDGSSVGYPSEYTFATVSGTHTVEVSFAIDEYEVVFDLGSNGTYGGGGALTQMVAHGASADAPVVNVETGWVFDSWNQPTNNITVAQTITAQYSRQQIELIVNSLYGAGDPAVNTTNTYDYGSSLTASITNSPVMDGPDKRYVCTGWNGTGSIGSGSTNETQSFQLTNSTTITWLWTTNYYITFGVQGN